MSKIDFHSHILPGIDDGARNLETSYNMHQMARQQEVDLMLATPHFYASQDRIDNFLKRREEAWVQFHDTVEASEETEPRIILGAEVAFFDGISRARDIEKLTIQGTNLMLLEMPFEAWNSQQIKEVEYLIKERKFQIIIAHLDRFLWIPGNKKWIKELLELPVSIQINADAFDSWMHTRNLVKLFKEGKAHVLGSDCHGAHHRVPNLQDGRDILEKKAGKEVLEQIDRQGEKLLSAILK